MVRRTFFCLLTALLLAPPSALAESHAAKERAARTACLAGEYTEGVKLLSELFVDTKDPTYLFNQGRCFEQNRRYEDAIARFQEYLRAGKNLGADEEGAAQKHIADCKELLASEKPVAPVAAPTPEPAPAPAPVVPPVVAATPKQETGNPAFRVTGIAVASVGAAALVSGVVLNLKANSLAQDLKKLDGYSAGKDSDRKTYETLAWVGYGVGAACVAAGAILYLVGRGGGGETVALAPIAGPGEAGAVVGGTF